jgi:hypothetical protein
MTRTAPSHVVKALRRYDAQLGARWNPIARQWEITRTVPELVYADSTCRVVKDVPATVLTWPHWDLTSNVMDRVRRQDGWRFGRRQDALVELVRRPLQAPRLERERNLRQYVADGREELAKCLLTDTGARVNVPVSGLKH